MDCCETDGFKRPREIRGEPTLAKTVRRRGVLKGAALVAGTTCLLASGVTQGAAKSATIQLAFCSQLLCVPPYEVTRDGGYFRDEGLDVQLVYMRGSTAAMQALVGGAVDYAATSFDDVLQAFNRGADIRRFYSTARLPLAALAIAPNRIAEINSFKDLEGRTIGIVSRGGIAEALTLFLMKKAGAEGKKIHFAILGPNIYDPVRLGQVDAAWVGEPALSLLVKEGGRALVNFMETDDAERYLGGRYEFMGVSVRTAEIAARREEMRALARALEKGLSRLQSIKPEEITAALPHQLMAGVDTAQLTDIFGRYRASLYPTGGAIDVAACERVADTLKFTGLIKPEVKAEQVLDLSIAGS
ncbi:NitT/TauT family transport system substrate-binding protein [Rhizobiales bacterium GAS113]|nr:NitT/TauT family transport system substrate-binding protein [Rhizobiales bacterium GAS113]